MKLSQQIKIFFVLLAFALGVQSCYTQLVLPKHNIEQSKVDSNRIASFTHTVIDTFYNEWLPDEGYYYQFRFDLKVIKEEKLDDFLNMLYAKGYNITGAWYIADKNNCGRIKYSRGSYRPVFIVLLSDVDDSITNYNFDMLLHKPYFPCPYKVWEFWSD